MDENQFRAEIAEIFREQDRRFERAQKRMDRMEATSKKRFAASERRLDRIEKLQDKNANAIASLQKVVSDLMDIYQIREQSADLKFENLHNRLETLEKGLK